jgi:hypothetical protein
MASVLANPVGVVAGLARLAARTDKLMVVTVFQTRLTALQRPTRAAVAVWSLLARPSTPEAWVGAAKGVATVQANRAQPILVVVVVAVKARAALAAPASSSFASGHPLGTMLPRTRASTAIRQRHQRSLRRLRSRRMLGPTLR